MMDSALAGIYSIATAMSTGAFSVIVRRGGSYANAVTGVLIGLIVTLPPLVAATWALWQPEWWNPRAWALLATGGLLGPAIGRVLYFSAIHHLGVARALPLAATMPLFAAAFGIGLLGERPGPGVLAGTALIVAGCISITFKKAGDTSWNRRLLWIPLVGVLVFSSSHIFRKVGVEMVDSPLVAITVMSFSGMCFLFLLSRLLPAGQRPQLGRPKAWLFYAAAGALNALSVLLHFSGLNLGDLTIVTPLSAMAPLFALLLIRFVLKDMERVTKMTVAGTLLIVLGGGIISWGVF
ncbi:MAG: DMT family transporter [bacterium]